MGASQREPLRTVGVLLVSFDNCEVLYEKQPHSEGEGGPKRSAKTLALMRHGSALAAA